MSESSRLSFSRFGDQIRRGSGIEQLMDDLGHALAERGREREGDTLSGGDISMLGGGNPAAIPEVTSLWRSEMRRLLDEAPDRFDRMLVNYDPSRGNPRFLQVIADFFRQKYGWDIGPDHIAVTNGGQTAFFYLINLLAGPHADQSFRKIVLPLVPEYIGYANQGWTHGYFRAVRPKIELLGDHQFKYRVDLDALHLTSADAAICVSRPTNPTGNVLTDDELVQLSDQARSAGIPLIIDNAYGAPFPNILFEDVQPVWDQHIVHTFSLSKLGLPGTRTGIVIGPPEITAAISSLNAIAGLANGNLGQVLVTDLVESGELARVSDTVIRSYYQQKSTEAQAILREYLPEGAARIHVSQGAMFLWLWLNLSIPSKELYRRLKDRGVLVVPGEYFFYGLDEPWEHEQQCIRMSFSMPTDTVRRGVSILAEEVRRVMRA